MSILDEQIEEMNKLNLVSDYLSIASPISGSLSTNTIANEAILQKAVEHIRSSWLQKVVGVTSSYNRAPWKGQIPRTVDGKPLAFTYERLLRDDLLAENLEYQNVIEKRLSKTILYDNGMSAIRGTLDLIDVFIKDTLKIAKSVGYFETRVLMDSMQNKGIIAEDLHENSDCNVYIFEPIQYTMEPAITDIYSLIKAINSSSSKAIFVIMDSTMHNSSRLLHNIERHLERNRNIIFVDIRSGVKLDQLGLEIGSLGIATWYVHKDNSKYAETLFNFINYFKGLLGDNISYDKYAALELFNTKRSFEYATQIHTIARDFYNSICVKSKKYINEIRFPVLSFEDCELTMPFIFIKFNLENREDYAQIVENIVGICAEHGLFLPYRNSFGFRYPSIEYICDYKTKQSVCKLCLGTYKGALYELLLEIIDDLCSWERSKYCEQIANQIVAWSNYEQ